MPEIAATRRAKKFPTAVSESCYSIDCKKPKTKKGLSRRKNRARGSQRVFGRYQKKCCHQSFLTKDKAKQQEYTQHEHNKERRNVIFRDWQKQPDAKISLKLLKNSSFSFFKTRTTGVVVLIHLLLNNCLRLDWLYELYDMMLLNIDALDRYDIM